MTECLTKVLKGANAYFSLQFEVLFIMAEKAWRGGRSVRQLATLIQHPGSREVSVHGASFSCSFNQSESLAHGMVSPHSR